MWVFIYLCEDCRNCLFSASLTANLNIYIFARVCLLVKVLRAIPKLQLNGGQICFYFPCTWHTCAYMFVWTAKVSLNLTLSTPTWKKNNALYVETNWKHNWFCVMSGCNIHQNCMLDLALIWKRWRAPKTDTGTVGEVVCLCGLSFIIVQ